VRERARRGGRALSRTDTRQFGEVTLAALRRPCRQTRKVVRAEGVAGIADLRADAYEQRLFDFLADRLAFLVEVEHLDQIGPLARR
jgi:hypothetical protein